MRSLLAIWAAKILVLACKITGRKSSTVPGFVALKICPDIVSILSKCISKEIVVVTGTNGKTTTNNLLYTLLNSSNYSVVCNNIGANMLSGVACALIKSSNIFGKLVVDYGCFEVDEAACLKVFDQLKPDYMIVLNLFRDQLDRYGEIDSIAHKLKLAIEKVDNLQLILNGDDPLTVQFGLGRPNSIYFGVDQEVYTQSDETKDGSFCIICGQKIKYNFSHYSQLGDFYCPDCGYKRPVLQFAVNNIQLADSIKFKINETGIDIHYKGFYNVYNVASVFATICELGVDCEDFNEILRTYKPQMGRMEEFWIQKPFILNLAKNPASFNQSISVVLDDSRKKDVIVAINDRVNDGWDVSWLWDVDFDRLAHDNLNLLFTSGMRRYDVSLRFKYADIAVDEINENMDNLILNSINSDSEVCYILVNYTALFSTQDILIKFQGKYGQSVG